MDHGESVGDAAWAPIAPQLLDASALLPGYRDFQLMARGGDSVVYRAHQDALDRDVAIKVVELDDAESVARFRRELAITVRLGRQHPHIMTVLDTGTTTSGQPCLVMDHFELGSLHDRLTERGPLPVSEVVAAGSVIADALAFAHTQGVLHRDVKPQNVLVLPTSWVLADFGLARAIDAGHSASLERFSYRHASPQVLDGEPPTVADDIYSLGSTLFTLLDGRAPYAADDPDEDSALSYLRRARTEAPRAISRDDVPPQLVGIVRRSLARDPAQRFADAAALRDALDAVPTETRSWAPDPAQPTAAPTAPVEVPEPELDDTFFAPPTATPVPAPAAPAPETPASQMSAPETSAPVPTVAAPPPVTAPSPATAPPPATLPPQAEAAPPPTARHLAAPIPTVALPGDPSPVAEPRVDSRPSGPFAPVPTAVSGEVEPERPAVSALAQLPDQARAARDAEATGLRPAEPPDVPLQHPSESEPDSRRRWVLIGVVGALALAGGIGVGVLRSGSDDPPPAATRSSPTAAPTTPTASATSTGRSIPVVRPTVPATTGVVRKGKDPRITSLTRGEAGSVVLQYTDPSKGTKTFVVFETESGRAAPVSSPQPKQTTVVLPAIKSGRRCFQVGVVTTTASSAYVTVGPQLCRTL